MRMRATPCSDRSAITWRRTIRLHQCRAELPEGDDGPRGSVARRSEGTFKRRTVVDEHARGGGVNVGGNDVAEDAAALRVDHDGVVHDRVVMLVVDQPVDAQERGPDVRSE